MGGGSIEGGLGSLLTKSSILSASHDSTPPVPRLMKSLMNDRCRGREICCQRDGALPSNANGGTGLTELHAPEKTMFILISKENADALHRLFKRRPRPNITAKFSHPKHVVHTCACPVHFHIHP